MEPIPHEITSRPGIQRDGTQLDSPFYLDGKWNRFAKGRPKKIGGYQAITQNLPEIVRGLTQFFQNSVNYIHLGGASFLHQVQTSATGLLLGENDRTPAGLTTSPSNLWQFDSLLDPVNKIVNIVAMGAPNLMDISSKVEVPTYYGQVDQVGAFVATGMDNQSGGCVILEPFLVTYGNAGRIDISNPNDLVNPNPNSSSPTGSKIVKALPLPGQGGPAGIFWSLNAVVVGTFAGINQGVLNYNTVSDQSSILSSQSVVEYDGVYYWAGGDRFLMYAGVVREVPNDMNLSYFFDNINMAFRQKAFAFKVPRWGEIWWCFPLGNATECNHAVIYNVKYNTWYDTALPDAGRSGGNYTAPFPRPLATDMDLTSSGYTLWQHELGVDKIVKSKIQPIDAYFQTSMFSPVTGNPPANKAMRVSRVEPDFVQTGPMTLTVLGQSNARAQNINSQPFTFPDLSNVPLGPGDQIVETKQDRRLLSLKFESNVPGGNYWAGKIIAHVEPTEGRVTT